MTHFRGVARECGLPAGVGCTWTNQAGALRRIARARELGFDHIHLTPPYWIKLNEPARPVSVDNARSGNSQTGENSRPRLA